VSGLFRTLQQSPDFENSININDFKTLQFLTGDMSGSTFALLSARHLRFLRSSGVRLGSLVMEGEREICE